MNNEIDIAPYIWKNMCNNLKQDDKFINLLLKEQQKANNDVIIRNFKNKIKDKVSINTLQIFCDYFIEVLTNFKNYIMNNSMYSFIEVWRYEYIENMFFDFIIENININEKYVINETIDKNNVITSIEKMINMYAELKNISNDSGLNSKEIISILNFIIKHSFTIDEMIEEKSCN